jgi:hypothetical protein
MSVLRDAPPDLDSAVRDALAHQGNAATQSDLRVAAANLAYRVRSRMIDLAAVRAEYGDEYAVRLEQARALVRLAADEADELLVREFASIGA